MSGTAARKREAPFSLRLTADERGALEERAGAMPLASFIKHRIFADELPYAGRRQSPVRDQRTIAQALAQLGRSELAASLRDLADAARTGSLDCSDEISAMLAAGCADIRAIRLMLVAALGLKPHSPPHAPTSTPRQAFDSASPPDAVR